MPRQLQSGLFFLPFGLAIGYLLANALAGHQLRLPIGYDYLAREFVWLWRVEPDLSVQLLLILGASAVGAFAFGAHFANEKLTTLGTSSWQGFWEMRRNGLLGEPGRGFVLAKTSAPTRRGRYITSDEHPNCLIVAPTGAGKGVGFVYPNLLTYQGSTVTLDIKGENYATTARRRAALGDKVYKFAPVQFGEASYRYNPLERIGKLDSYSAVSFELRKIATLFLQADSAGEWLNGAIQLFTVAGGVAYERGTFTLGGIYDVLAEGDANLKSHLGALGKAAREPSLAKELASLAKLEQRTLSSYMSVLNNAGFDLWSNPHIAAMTSASDFSFADLRRERASIYFVVADADLKPLAGLVRLFFNELVATIQAAKPGEDEP
ncbi:type IV secretory system conjugative DNA transfer family protein, partial [Jannaschia aquimarina]|uniref:type IV secretory system conjugative DNA transfer family protein n=1 Tax=Jannaschia aquimarina TaxID=935700 RepID=UPI000B66229A